LGPNVTSAEFTLSAVERDPESRKKHHRVAAQPTQYALRITHDEYPREAAPQFFALHFTLFASFVTPAKLVPAQAGAEK